MGGPLADAALDRGARRGRGRIPESEHAGGAAGPEHRLHHVRRPARDLPAGCVLVMTPVVLGFPARLFSGLAWPWYVPLGTAVTVAVGMGSSLVTNGDGKTA